MIKKLAGFRARFWTLVDFLGATSLRFVRKCGLHGRLFNLLLTILLSLLGAIPAFSQTVTYTNNGTYTIPAGVATVTVQAWGGGGGAGGLTRATNATPQQGSSGGGGGGFIEVLLPVSPGDMLDVIVGAGGNGGLGISQAGFDGTSSRVSLSGSVILVAEPGEGGGPSGNNFGGPGGASSFTAPATLISSATGGAGQSGLNGSRAFGGAGGDGGGVDGGDGGRATPTRGNHSGSIGSPPGGGASGARRRSRGSNDVEGRRGARGEVRITPIPVEVTIADVSQPESGTFMITATLDNAVPGGFTVPVSTTDGTAIAPADYMAIPAQVLTFEGTAGEPQTFTITVVDDPIPNEGNETLTVSMGTASNPGVVTTDTATVTIIDNDVASPSLLVSKTDVTATAPTAVGDVVEWEIRVENTGNVSLTGISLNDILTDGDGNTLTGISGPTLRPATDLDRDGEIDTNETWIYDVGYTLTQADVDSGSVQNNVEVTTTEVPGPTPPPGPPPVTTITPVSHAGNSMVIATSPVLADGVDTALITVTVRDANNNPIRGSLITLSQTGSAIISGITDNGDGTYTATMTNTTAETVTVTAVTDGVTISQSPDVTFLAQGSIKIVLDITGPDRNVSFTSSTPALTFDLATSGGSGEQLVENLTAGTYTVTSEDLTPAGYGITSIVCNDNDSTGDLASRTATINLALQEKVVCTFVVVESREHTSQIIADYLGARNRILLAHQPDRKRRLDRLNGRFGGGQLGTVRVNAFGANANLSIPRPWNINISKNELAFSGSTSNYFDFGIDNDAMASAYATRSHWDIWTEGKIARYDNNGEEGNFGVLYGGVDYLINPNALVGMVAQYDWLNQSTGASNGSSVKGSGWMVGPYGLIRLTEDLYFDGRVAWGRSRNKIKPFNTYEDEFDTERWLLSAAVIGEYTSANWTVRPAIRFQYIEEYQESYIDSLGVTIPSQTVSQGDLRVGPRIEYNHQLDDRSLLTPWVEFEGVYSFAKEGRFSKGSFADQSNGINASVKAGLEYTHTNGSSLMLTGQLDNLGSETISYGAGFKLTVPIQ